MGVPTTLSSVRPWPGNWVCFWRTSRPRWAADQAQEDQRDDEDVEDEEAGDDDAVAGEVPAEDEGGQVAADDGDRQDDGVGDADARPRDEVVGQGVAEEPLHDGQRQQGHADEPVELAGLAEGAGEEDPGHVHGDGPDEDVGRPVVHLADDETAAHGEGEVDRRGVGGRHLDAPQRDVGAVVDDLGRRGDEVQRQEDAGGQEDDEGVEGDLPEQERPVVGEDLVQQGAAALGHAQPVVQPPDGAVDRLRLGGARRRRTGRRWATRSGSTSSCSRPLPEPGPDGLVVTGLRPRKPSASIISGSCGSGRGAGPKTCLRPLGDVEQRLVAGAEQLEELLLVEADRAAGVGAHLGVGHIGVGYPARAGRPAPARARAAGRMRTVWSYGRWPSSVKPSGNTVMKPPTSRSARWMGRPVMSTR